MRVEPIAGLGQLHARIAWSRRGEGAAPIILMFDSHVPVGGGREHWMAALAGLDGGYSSAETTKSRFPRDLSSQVRA